MGQSSLFGFALGINSDNSLFALLLDWKATVLCCFVSFFPCICFIVRFPLLLYPFLLNPQVSIRFSIPDTYNISFEFIEDEKGKEESSIIDITLKKVILLGHFLFFI